MEVPLKDRGARIGLIESVVCARQHQERAKQQNNRRFH
jgi:hypothetical protein